MIQKVSIILPTYQEKENVLPLIQEISKQLENRNFEIIIVDDDSPDLTWKIVEDYAKEDRRVRVVRRVVNRGLTWALNEGIEKAEGDVVVWMDCDFQHPPALLPQLLENIENGYDVAVASRFVNNHAGDYRGDRRYTSSRIILFHAFLSKALCKMCSYLFCPTFTDWTSGYIALKKDFFNKHKLIGDYGEYFIILMNQLIREKYKIVEIPYFNGIRTSGSSKTTKNYFVLLSKGINYIRTLVRLKFFM